jgi:predicted RNase H-like HicB family nuclease
MNRHTHHTLTAVFERCDEGGFHAFIKEIPGVHSEGDSIEEAKENLIDALQLILSYRMEKSLEHKDLSRARRFEAELVA